MVQLHSQTGQSQNCLGFKRTRHLMLWLSLFYILLQQYIRTMQAVTFTVRRHKDCICFFWPTLLKNHFMQLETFISETLISIINGVGKAQDQTKGTGARINPVRFNAPDDQYVYFGKEEGKKPLSIISFDIAVTTSKSDEDKIGGGIKVFSFDISGKKTSSDQNEVVSRIKFDIGAVLPFTDGISDRPFEAIVF